MEDETLRGPTATRWLHSTLENFCPGSSAFVPGLDVPVGDAKACQGALTKLTPFDTSMGHCRTGEPPGTTTNQLPGPFRPSRGVAGNGGFEEPLRNTMAPIRAFQVGRPAF